MKKTFAVVAILIAAATGLFWPGAGSRGWIEADVPPGSSGSQVATDFRTRGLLRSRTSLLVWIRLRNAGGRIHPGHYKFPSGRSGFWIADDLIDGRTEKMKITIPEGFASWQIAERLESLKICNAAAFRQVVQSAGLEGFLFPATYDLDQGLEAATVAAFLKSRFDERWTPEFEQRASAAGMTQKEVVTLASIVQREVRVMEEAPRIAAVYHNRLRQKMKLDADPTVQYALGFWKTRLTYKDYRNVKSPYNTYLNPGLPPGPICSPGLDAIRAALWPAASNDIYFVANEDGTHSFSPTYREHVNKVNRRNRRLKELR